MAVARRAGILKPEEAGRMYAVMHAEQFRTTVGPLRRRRRQARTEEELAAMRGYEDNEDGEGDMVDEPENAEAFLAVVPNLRVLARATAADKHLLVAGLKALDRRVVSTGDGINDVYALESADVGLAMGSGCSAAKEAADLILTDDDFEASLRAVMWGRNIYHNVSRFLQFQVTVNISALLTVFIGACYFTESPLSAVQLLWINLLMDTFAALALATEPPLPSVIKGPPFAQRAPILSGPVWRQILGVSAWNVLVMTILIFFGPFMGGLLAKEGDPAYDRTVSPSYHLGRDG